jgi:amino acid transporter
VVNRRVLTLWDLVVYGVVLIQPIAPVGIFGVALKISNGHAVTTILIALVAMMLTAVSYGRMAALYPSAGSAYTYVGRGFGPYAGFLVGWAMFVDYLIIPVVNVIYGALTIQRLLPEVPYAFWVAIFAVGMIALNLRGVRSLARANTILLAAMCAVVGAFVILAVRYLLHQSGWAGVFSPQPFYNPATFDLRAVMTATSLAALTYIGFDGVTTLAEETQNPRRTIPLATVLVCLVTGLFSAVEVYLGQRVWPDYQNFPNLETAFLDVTQRVGGVLLFQGMAAVLIVACFGSGLTGLAAAARLLYGMGREDMLPKRLFGRLDAKRNQPSSNIWIIGALALGGALVLSYERSAELINFGAFLAFMGVNLVAIRSKPKPVSASVCAGLGFAFCVWIWWSLPLPAKMAGGAWCAAGLAWTAVKTRGFSVQPAAIDFVDTKT